MNLQELIDKPGYGSHENIHIVDEFECGWLVGKIEDILNIKVTEDQRLKLNEVAEQHLEDYVVCT